MPAHPAPGPVGEAAALETVVALGAAAGRRFDLASALALHLRGAGDPTMRVGSGAAVRATSTAAGPAALELRVADGGILARAWGPGAATALDAVPALLGLDDDDSGFDPSLHPVVAQLARRKGRVRLGRTGAVWEALLPAILEQRITGTEAWRGVRRLVRTYGTPAPGPHGLLLAPAAGAVAALPSYDLVALGIEPRRATLLRRIARETPRLEALAAGARQAGGGGAGAARLTAALLAMPGIGPWTAAEVTLRAIGDPDAVSVGDAHLSDLVGFALAGRPRSTDDEMLALLAPWTGHRARVVRLLERAGITPPRYGPRVAPRDLARDLTPSPGRRPVARARHGSTRRPGC